jgi:hypothetical protein
LKNSLIRGGKPLQQAKRFQSFLHRKDQLRPKVNPTLIIIAVVNQSEKIPSSFISGKRWSSLHEWQTAGGKKEENGNTSVNTGEKGEKNG